MKAEKEETIFLLDIAGKGSFRTSVKVTVKGITDKIPGGWNSWMEANNTQCDSGCVERVRRRRERQILVDGIVRRTPVKPNMILC